MPEGGEWVELLVGGSSAQWKENQPSVCWGGVCFIFQDQLPACATGPRGTQGTGNTEQCAGERQTKLLLPGHLSRQAKDHGNLQLQQRIWHRTQVIQHCFWQGAPINSACDCFIQHSWNTLSKLPWKLLFWYIYRLSVWPGTHPALKEHSSQVRSEQCHGSGWDCLQHRTQQCHQGQKWDFQLREPILQTLSHPGLMEIYDRKPGRFSLVEESLKGTGLDRWLTAGTPLLEPSSKSS